MNEEQRARAPLRIERSVVVLGASAFLIALAVFTWRDAVGLGFGATLAWLNFRWMRTSVSGLAAKLAQGTSGPKGSTAVLTAKFLLRYALLVVAVYATLKGSVASVLGIFAGLLVIVPA